MSINTTKDHLPAARSNEKCNIILRLTVGLAVGAIVVPLAVVFLLSAAVLLVPAAPVVAVAVLAALLVLAARGKQAWAAAGLPRFDARPDRCPLPRAHARVRSVL